MPPLGHLRTDEQIRHALSREWGSKAKILHVKPVNSCRKNSSLFLNEYKEFTIILVINNVFDLPNKGFL